MQYLHTMVRVQDLNHSLDFYCGALGLQEMSRKDSEAGRFTLIFLGAPDDIVKYGKQASPMLELTHNWGSENYTGGRNFGHLAYAVDNIYVTCNRLIESGVVINRPPRDGRMAFVRSPDNISIELLQKNEALELQEPWISMPNQGEW